MPALIAQQLAFQLHTGEVLFEQLNFNLPDGVTGLVGRNGTGKSVLISILSGNILPTAGYVSKAGHIESYSQLPSHLLNKKTTIAEYLGIADKLMAYQAIVEGSYSTEHFETLSDDWQVEKNALDLLETLSIPADLSAQCSTLSGGQLALLQLHQLFYSGADILLLDEPSNHLDGKARNWLVAQIKKFTGRILLVSHDRVLLENTNGIYQLDTLGLTYFNGNYSRYEQQVNTQKQALDKRITHLKLTQKYIDKQAQLNKEKAEQRQAKGNKLRAVGSQPKVLLDAKKDKAGQSQASAAKSHQGQLSRNQHQLTQLEQKQEIISTQSFYMPKHEIKNKGKTLVTLEQVKLKFVPHSAISFSIIQGHKLHLMGGNGSGKSSLLKAIHHQHNNFIGSISRHSETVYLDQHFSLLNEEHSVLENVLNFCCLVKEEQARTLLAGIGFKRESVKRTVKCLSGGEKMKLSMLMVSYHAHIPLLLLDEPDNHLDLDSKVLLAATLNDYRGAFMLVSHDQAFVRDIHFDRSFLIS